MQTKQLVVKALRRHALQLGLCLSAHVLAALITTLAVTELVRRLIGMAAAGDVRPVYTTVLLLFACTVLLAVAKTLKNRQGFALKVSLTKTLEDELIRRVLASSVPFDPKQRIAQINRTASEIVDSCLNCLTGLTGAVVVVIAITVYMAFLDAALVLICYITGVVSFFIFGRRIGDITPYTKEHTDRRNDLFALSWEHLNNAEVSGFLSGKKVFRRMDEGIKVAKDALIRLNKRRNYVRILERSAYYVNTILYLICTAVRFQASQRFDLAASSAGMILLPQFAEAFYSIPRHINSYKGILGLFEVTDAMMREERVIDEGNAERPTPDRLTVKNLSFQYKSQENRLPKSIRLHGTVFLPAQIVFIVGETGSGKSTLLKLMCRKIDGYDGEIRWDDADIRSIEPRAMSRQILYLHEPVAFHDTIEKNITLSTAPADDLRLAESLRRADFDGYVGQWPEGCAHVIKASELSTGENQKLSIARIFYHRHRHFFLDEIMSGVDRDSQMRILKQFRALARERAAVFVLVTHTLTLLEPQDPVIFIDGEGECHVGSHEYLYGRHAPYRTFYDGQSV